MTSDDTHVILSPREKYFAAKEGVRREVENQQKNRKPRDGAPTYGGWTLHIEGCLAEFALARFLGVEWTGRADFRGDDVGGAIECKVTSQGEYLRLFPRQLQVPKPTYALWGLNGSYQVLGWTIPAELDRAEIAGLWDNGPQWKGGNSYHVPPAMLQSPFIRPLQLLHARSFEVTMERMKPRPAVRRSAMSEPYF